jgi:hypothetical protein
MNLKINPPKVLSLMLIGYAALTSFKPVSPKANSNGNDLIYLSSERLSKDVADQFRSTYKNSPDVLTTVDGAGKAVKLQTFTFKASDMKEILSKINTADGTADKVVFKFALDDKNKRRWRLLVYGMTNNSLLENYDASANHYTIFYNTDYASRGTRRKKNEAKSLRQLYEQSKLLHTVDKSGNAIPLYGFAFNADQIDELLNNNVSGEKSPDKIALYLGLEMVGDNKRWHVVAYGLKNGTLLDYVASPGGKGAGLDNELAGQQPSIFDKADPCPPCN